MKDNFFQYLDFAMQFAPAGSEEKEIRAKLASIGIGPGKTFDFKDLSLEHKTAVGLGMKQGSDKVDKFVAGIGKTINGWGIYTAFGDRAFFNGNWLLRAAGAKIGIYANDAAEAMYPKRRHDADGELLDGSKHNYTLTFPAGGLPIENPINRYLINSPMLPDMKKNEDGSLTLYIQKDSPGADKEAN